VKQAFPAVHLHAFSPEEVLYGATRSGATIRDYIGSLKDAGLGSLPGTSAEILDQDIRDVISPGRITVRQWIEVITTAHDLGLPTIQSSWVKEGPKFAQYLLSAGANDVGGTLMNESISTSAGAQYGQLLQPRELRRLIRDSGRTPAQRNTKYELLKVFKTEDDDISTLDRVQDADSRFGSYEKLATSSEFRFKR
jgi:2-iminoacetate synthase ThiH